MSQPSISDASASCTHEEVRTDQPDACPGCQQRDRRIAALEAEVSQYASRADTHWQATIPLLRRDHLHVACIFSSFISLLVVVSSNWIASIVQEWFMNTSDSYLTLGCLVFIVVTPPILLSNWLSMLLLLPVSQRFRWLFLVPVVLGMFIMHRTVAEIIDESNIAMIAWFAPFVGLSMLLPSVIYVLSVGKFQLGEHSSRTGLSDMFLLTLLTALALASAQFTTEDIPEEALPGAAVTFAISVLGPCLLLGVAQLLVSKRVCEGTPRAAVAYPIAGLLLLGAGVALAVAAITSGYTDFSMLQDSDQQLAGLLVVSAIPPCFIVSTLLTWRLLITLQGLANRRPRRRAAVASQPLSSSS